MYKVLSLVQYNKIKGVCYNYYNKLPYGNTVAGIIICMLREYLHRHPQSMTEFTRLMVRYSYCACLDYLYTELLQHHSYHTQQYQVDETDTLTGLTLDLYNSTDQERLTLVLVQREQQHHDRQWKDLQISIHT